VKRTSTSPRQVNSFLAIEGAEYSWQQIWQIFCNKAGPELGGRSTVQPYRSGGAKERIHTLREKPDYDAAQHIA
jgi:hypothetical protein